MTDQGNEEWINSVGGLTKATMLIAKTLKCGFSKADKIARGKYPSKLPDEQAEALADLRRKKSGRKSQMLVTASKKRTA